MSTRLFTKEEEASWPEGHKKCRSCQEVLPFSKFHKHKQAVRGHSNDCKECRKPIAKLEWQNKSFEKTMLATSRYRAKKKDIPHTIELKDIVIPKTCPILGVPIVMQRGHMYGPSLDRIKPSLGYIPSNIMVMSNRANSLKNNMTIEESFALWDWFNKRSPRLLECMGVEEFASS